MLSLRYRRFLLFLFHIGHRSLPSLTPSPNCFPMTTTINSNSNSKRNKDNHHLQTHAFSPASAETFLSLLSLLPCPCSPSSASYQRRHASDTSGRSPFFCAPFRMPGGSADMFAGESRNFLLFPVSCPLRGSPTRSDGFQHPTRIGSISVLVDLTMWQLASFAFYRWGESEKAILTN